MTWSICVGLSEVPTTKIYPFDNNGSRVGVRSRCLSPFCYAIVFSERELTFAFAICCRHPSVVWRLSVTLVHPTQVVVISAIFLRH